MNVVIDTNVLASGIFWDGVPFKVIQLWINNHIEVIVSKEILDEYLRTFEKITNHINRPDLYEQ